ncbi:hypothetical protein AB0I10_18685 [Streptomyces sp. NPDC050636]|uniref:GNAT family N-acetyltransferase n=1 Tax=Streptomyces sp. NPDC050636 TaxID=3154510 RepID=UPI00343DF600
MAESQRRRTGAASWQVRRAPDRLLRMLRVLRGNLAVRPLAGLAPRPVLPRARRRRVTLPAGEAVTLRPATARDLPAVTALHALCAPTTSRAPTGFPARDELSRLLHPRVGHSLLAEAAAKRPVGWGLLVRDGLRSDAVLLAADAWKDRGLATVLLRTLCGAAVEAGCQVLWVYAAHRDAAVHEAVTALGLPHAADRAATATDSDAEATIYAVRLTTSIPAAPGPVDGAGVGRTQRPVLFGRRLSSSDTRQLATSAG